MSRTMTNQNEENSVLQNQQPEEPAKQTVKLILQMTADTETKQKVAQLQQELTMEQARRYRAEAQLNAQKCKAPSAAIVSGCEKSITVREMAQLLYQSGADTGETRLYQWLRSAGYVYRLPCGKNMPSQKSLDYGLLELRGRLYQRKDGYQMLNKTLVVTPKGQEYFMLLLGGDNAPCKKNHKNRKSA